MNIAGEKGRFAMISSNSKLRTIHFTIADSESNSILISDNSQAEMKHVILSDWKTYCPIIVLKMSNIVVRAIYFQHGSVHEKAQDENRNIVCIDTSSSGQGAPSGM